VEAAWPSLRVDAVKNDVYEIGLGEQLQVSARVALNNLTPDDVLVQVVSGSIDASGEITNPVAIAMQPSGKDDSGRDLFQAVFQPSAKTGLHGYSIRVLPRHQDLISSFLPGLITWTS
jgi:starch phosphorylase